MKQNNMPLNWKNLFVLVLSLFMICGQGVMVLAEDDIPKNETEIQMDEENEAVDEPVKEGESVDIEDAQFQKDVVSDAQEPIENAGASAGDPIGRNLTWEITGTAPNQNLIISGYGAMYDFSANDPVPWKSYASSIRTVILPEGMTHIGNYAFDGFTGVFGDLSLPSTLKTIGSYAFRNSTFNNNPLTIPEGVESIGEYAFYGCKGFTGGLVIPGNTKSVRQYAFYDCTGFTGSLVISS
nr:leucine-rich repeat domain-containing protein [Lachnospiraceae bacterium]